jgi:curved DNA-binding protein CbpA
LEKDVLRVLDFLRGNHFNSLQLPSSRRNQNQALAGTAKKAFHRLARLYHPDKNVDVDTTALYSVIRAAYECLSDPGAERSRVILAASR